ncbi:MAG: PAC2 family protein, partial [Candidatus Bathyarchaeia archaeon]
VVSSTKIANDFERYGIILTKTGAITGACGIMLGLGHKRKLDCMGLLGATRGEYPDLSAAKSVLKVLSRVINLDVNLGKLDSEIQEMKSKVENLRKAQMEAFRTGHEDKAPFYV